MLLHALPVVILWIVLPMAALAVLRNSKLPRLTMSLTLACGLLALLAISLPNSTLTSLMPAQAPEDLFLARALDHYLIGLAMTLFGAGGLVLLIGGLARGAKAGIVAGIGAFGLLLFYLAAGLQIARQTVAGHALPADPVQASGVHDLLALADTASALGFLAGAGLILLLFVLTLLSLFRRG